jgi:hypothetical protein
MRRDFWLSCGHHLLDHDSRGRLVVTDDFLKVYFARPELVPPDDACAAERNLWRSVLADPRLVISSAAIGSISDSDARDNWQLMLQWRDHLLSYATLEEAYLNLVRDGLKFPHLFLNQLVQVILRNVLDDCEDAFVLRAAELFFRSQRLTSIQGSLISLDEETAAEMGSQPVSPLRALLGLSSGPELDVLSDSNEAGYWERSDTFDLGLDLTAGRRGLSALGEVIARWTKHMLDIEVSVLPLTEVRNVALSWYVGLDAEGTRLGDALWRGEALDERAQRRLVGLYKLDVMQKVEDEPESAPTYLFFAMSDEMTLFLKPQNLLIGLPLNQAEAVQ